MKKSYFLLLIGLFVFDLVYAASKNYMQKEPLPQSRSYQEPWIEEDAIQVLKLHRNGKNTIRIIWATPSNSIPIAYSLQVSFDGVQFDEYGVAGEGATAANVFVQPGQIVWIKIVGLNWLGEEVASSTPVSFRMNGK